MKTPGDDFAREYVSAVANYLDANDEITLSVAYELGRRALGDGLGILDMASMHGDALETLVVHASSEARARVARAAAAFFRELLSPFEMSFRGYRDANRELQRLNQALARKNEAVETANRELEAFSYSVSHDLRAPLRSIDGFSQALLEDCAEILPEQGKQYLRYVRESAQEMGRLIDALLGLARVARSELEHTDVDLAALARRIARRLTNAEPGRQAGFVIPETLRANGDLRLLGAMLENLLGNAWKFSSKRARAEIELGCREQAGRTVYFVRDNGAGFDMTHARKLFGAFQRLHSSQEFEGTGIGLATVQRIVHRHGGQVWAEGQVDVGASFYFTLGSGTQS